MIAIKSKYFPAKWRLKLPTWSNIIWRMLEVEPNENAPDINDYSEDSEELVDAPEEKPSSDEEN